MPRAQSALAMTGFFRNRRYSGDLLEAVFVDVHKAGDEARLPQFFFGALCELPAVHPIEIIGVRGKGQHIQFFWTAHMPSP